MRDERAAAEASIVAAIEALFQGTPSARFVLWGIAWIIGNERARTNEKTADQWIEWARYEVNVPWARRVAPKHAETLAAAYQRDKPEADLYYAASEFAFGRYKNASDMANQVMAECGKMRRTTGNDRSREKGT